MKKRIILGITFLTFTLGIFAWIFLAQPNVFLSTVSPNETYTVELTGDKASPSFPFFDHQANFNLFKNSQPLVRNAYVKSYDWFDSGFEQMYPAHKWVSDSVLRFGSDISRSQRSSDFLIASNRTNKTIKYLKITAGDMLFIFEMPPNSKSKFSVPYLGELPWVTGEGEFADGQKVKWNGVNFQNKEKLKDSLRHCISVEDNGLKIESPIMNGFNGDGASEKPNILKAANCDL